MPKPYHLGLDIGTHSIGWARIDRDTQKLIDGGVRIASTDHTQASPAAVRRQKRSSRRQYARRRKRKDALIRVLQKQGMFPPCTSQDLQSNPLPEHLQSFFDQNPYLLRAQACGQADSLQAPLTPMQLGRIFYHFAQRRGYTSNRLSDDIKEGGTMQSEKDARKLGMIALLQTEDLIHEYGTLGHALYQIDQQHTTDQGLIQHEGRPHLRRRYTQRQWYQDEFNTIWQQQQPYHPQLCHDTFKQALTRILFAQRPLKSQRHLIEQCSIDPTRKRVTQHNLDVEAFVFYKTLNNITINGQPLTEAQREVVIAKHKYRASYVTFSVLARSLKVDPCHINYRPEDTLPTCQLADAMQKIFGPTQWTKLSAIQQASHLNNIRHIRREAYLKTYARKIYRAYKEPLSCQDLQTKIKALQKTYQKNPANLAILKDALAYLSQGFAFYTPHNHTSVDQALLLHIEKKIVDLYNKMQKGRYSKLSLQVIQQTLPYLKQGYQEHIALPLASLERVVRIAAKNGHPIPADPRNTLAAQVADIITDKGESDAPSQKQTERIALFLEKNHRIPRDITEAYLYHHSDPAPNKLYDALPRELVKDLRNPTVNRIVSELRLLINTLIQQYGKPRSIAIETGRSLKQSKRAKARDTKRMEANQRKNNLAQQLLYDHQKAITTQNILKARLYLETQGSSLYPIPGQGVGKQIDLNKLFTAQWQIEHIVPQSITFDSSHHNLTLCHVDENQKKSNRTPYQAYKHDHATWETMKVTAQTYLPPKKYRHFVNEATPIVDDFLSRQLSDNAYIAQETRRLCRYITPDVTLVQGGITTTLRTQWGLHTVDITQKQLKKAGITQDGMYYLILNPQNDIVHHQADPRQSHLYHPTDRSQAFDKARQKLKKSQGGEGRVVWGYVKDGLAEISSKAKLTNPIVRAPHLKDGSYLLLIDDHNDNQLLASAKNPWEEEKKAYTAWHTKQTDKIKAFEKKLRGMKQGKVIHGEVHNHKFTPTKDREDHRHHLIDAITIAYTCRGYLQKLSQKHAQGIAYQDLGKHLTFPLPYSTLHRDVKQLLHTMLVSFRQTNKHYQKRGVSTTGKDAATSKKIYHDAVRGGLHNDTLYGQYHHLHDKPFHIRKSIQDLKKTQLTNIVDPSIQASIQAWFSHKKGTPYQKADHSNPVPIKKVTLQEEGELVHVGRQKWAKPANNYMAIYYRDQNTGEVSGHVLTFFDAIQRKKAGQKLVALPAHQALLCTFRINDYCIFGLTSAQVAQIDWQAPTSEDYTFIHRHLYRVQMTSVAEIKRKNKTYIYQQVTLRKHCAATNDYHHETTTISPATFKSKNNAIVKVKIDRLGHIIERVYPHASTNPLH